jgi:hypothetical protein
MKKFIRKTILFFLPFVFLVILYFIFDPFKVLYKYDSYFNDSVNGVVFLNTDYVSTSNFDNHYEKFHYNSFILGNSRGWFYEVSDWKNYIGDEPAYHFTTGGESLYAIHKKVLYLDAKGVDIKNAMLVLDYDILVQDGPKSGHLGIMAPQLENNQNWFQFHLASIRGFFNISFMYAYIDFIISGKVKSYMERNRLLDNRPFTYNNETNQISFATYERLISNNDYYTDERMKVFYERENKPSYSPVSIEANQKRMLLEILLIFEKHKTNYKIIISPVYSQERLAKEDVAYLKDLFGVQYVFNFSGKNRFTEDFHNYYESDHYRPHIAKEIMEIVYREDNLRASKKERFLIDYR